MNPRRRSARSRARWPEVVIALVLLAIPFSMPAPVSANASTCQGSYRERHLGWLQGGLKWGAVATDISGAFAICTDPTPFTIAGSFAWSNIQGVGADSIVQIGVGRCRRPVSSECDGSLKLLYAWGRAPGGSCLTQLPLPQEISAWNGVAGSAEVTRIGANWVLAWNGVGMIAIPYTYTSCSWTPTSATFFTETWNDGDSNGGNASSPYQIRHMQYQNAIGGAFTSVNTSSCNINDGGNAAKYKCTAFGDQISTWTVQ